MVLVRAKNIEELKARPLRRQLLLLGCAVDNREIEQMLRPAVKIHWPQFAQLRQGPVIGEPLIAVAIGCGGRRVNERRLVVGAPVQQVEGQAEIVFHHGIAVARGSLGNRTQMDHSVELAAVQPAHQVGGRHEVGQLALLEVAPLVVLAEQVIDNNIGSARLIETGDDIRPDKSGAAGD